MIKKDDVSKVARSINLKEPTKEQMQFVFDNYHSQAKSDPAGSWDVWVEQLLYDAGVPRRVHFRFTFDSGKAELMDGSCRYGGTVFCNGTPIKYMTYRYDSRKAAESRFEQYIKEVSIKPNKRRADYYFLNDKQGERLIELK